MHEDKGWIIVSVNTGDGNSGNAYVMEDEGGDLTVEELIYYADKLQPMPVIYELTMLPQGYSLWKKHEENGLNTTFYARGKDVLSFTYGEQGSVDLSRGVDCEQETADLNGVTAELYLADNPADESSIIWTVGETSLTISGHLSSQELVELAASDKKVTEIEEWVWPAYDFAQVPDGYVKLAEGDTSDSRDIFYAKEEDVLNLYCFRSGADTSEQGAGYSENMILETGYVNGQEADLFISPDGLECSGILWTEGDILFHINGFLPIDVLIALAETITVRPREYRLCTVLEGYAEFTRHVVPEHAMIIYENEEGKLCQFGYTRDADADTLVVSHDHHTGYIVSVNGAQADLFLADDPEACSSVFAIWKRQRFTQRP